MKVNQHVETNDAAYTMEANHLARTPNVGEALDLASSRIAATKASVNMIGKCSRRNSSDSNGYRAVMLVTEPGQRAGKC